MSASAGVPFGSWPSPVSAASLVAGLSMVGEIRSDGDDVWWTEQRPSEGGRCVLVRRTAEGTRDEPFSAPGEGATDWDVRTGVGEYGGGAWGARGGTVVFAHWGDQRVYRLDRVDGDDDGWTEPVPLTPAPTSPREWRYADPEWIDDEWLVCVRECHSADVLARSGQASTELVAVPLNGSASNDPSRVVVLWSGPDFVSSPAVHGRELVFLQWNHPQMPWDGTEVVHAQVAFSGSGPTLEQPRVVLGGVGASCVQPGFDPQGRLVVVSETTGWWNPVEVNTETGEVTSLLAEPMEAEFAGPRWVGGMRWWCALDDGRLAFVVTANGTQRIGILEGGRVSFLDNGFTEISQLIAHQDGAVAVAATATSLSAPYAVGTAQGQAPELLRPAEELVADKSYFSAAEPITFTSGARQAHALFYPPHHLDMGGPAGEAPPLVVMIHGGPTAAAINRLSLAKQFWTTRGFAVLDVDYAGSTGYGREYRELLRGQWGVADVEDAVAAARYLADAGRVDGRRLVIRGGSAGGFTTLAALARHTTFTAGCSLFGVADLAALAGDTHKFESRYLDSLVGPYPEAADVYAERSPINHLDGFDVPLLVLQGSEDAVVPPNQAEMIVNALASRGVPHAYMLFDGEGHGFRQEANIIAALEAELWFYGRVFGIDLADDLSPVPGAVGL